MSEENNQQSDGCMNGAKSRTGCPLVKAAQVIAAAAVVLVPVAFIVSPLLGHANITNPVVRSSALSTATAEKPTGANQTDQLWKTINLNNDGVKLLQKNKYEDAVEKLRTSLKRDPNYRLARCNLSIAYNNLGLEQAKTDIDKAIASFERALFCDPENKTSEGNLNTLVQSKGRDPKNFDDQIAMAKEAIRRDCMEGGVVHYKAALKLKDDAHVKQELEILQGQLRNN